MFWKCCGVNVKRGKYSMHGTKRLKLGLGKIAINRATLLGTNKNFSLSTHILYLIDIL